MFNNKVIGIQSYGLFGSTWVLHKKSVLCTTLLYGAAHIPMHTFDI